MAVEERVYDLLTPVIETVSVELIDVEWVGGTLRLTIDTPTGVSAQNVAEVNRLVSPLLDQHDAVPGSYTLEVSSPGIERALNKPAHFERAIGEKVLVKLYPDAAEYRRILGVLLASDDQTVVIRPIELDGVEMDAPTVSEQQPTEDDHRIAYASITKARTVFDWGDEAKSSKRSKSKNAAKKSNTRKAKRPAKAGDSSESTVKQPTTEEDQNV